MIQSYRDLTVYQRSYQIALTIYELAKTIPEEERYGIISQLKRASLSVPLNIAEGYSKNDSELEFKRYLRMAMGSCNEMNVLLDFCKDLGYIAKEKHEEYGKEYDELGRMLNSLISKWTTNEKV